MLQCLDLQIVDRRSQALVRGDGLQCHVVAVGLVSTGRLPAATSQQRVRMDDALHAMWRRDTDVDDFNKLVTHAELTWKDVAVLRTYARYLRQLGQPFSARFASSVLVEHADIATALVDLFRSQVVGATATDGARHDVSTSHRPFRRSRNSTPTDFFAHYSPSCRPRRARMPRTPPSFRRGITHSR